MVYITLPIFMHIIIGTRIPKSEGGAHGYVGHYGVMVKVSLLPFLRSFLLVIKTESSLETELCRLHS